MHCTETCNKAQTEVGSYPGHLSEVRVHVLVTDWNHLPDAPVVTVERDTVKTNYQVVSVSSITQWIIRRLS